MTIAPLRRALGTAGLMACLGVAGCAGTGRVEPAPQGAGSVRTPAGQTLAPPAAMDSIAVGKSTRAEIAAALGPAVVVPFDSGYEVWLYRWAGADRTPRAATELVVLFAPSGLATKVRLRPGYAPRE